MKKLVCVVMTIVMILLLVPVSISAVGSTACLAIDKKNIDKVSWIIPPSASYKPPGSFSEISEYPPGLKRIYREDVLSESLFSELTNKYDSLFNNSTNGYVGVASNIGQDGRVVWRHGLIDEKGVEVIPPIYDRVSFFSDGLVQVMTDDNKWGYLDIDGNYKIGPNDFKNSSGGFYNVYFNFFYNGIGFGFNDSGNPVFIDKQGNLALPDIFSIGGVTLNDGKGGLALWRDGGVLIEVQGVGYGVMKLDAWQNEPLKNIETTPNVYTTEGKKNGIKLTATVTNIGILFDWEPSNSALGYRIYRSKVKGGDGVSINDFPLRGSEFFDANVEPDTQYYYSIAEVESEASFGQKAVTLTPERVGPRGEELPILTTVIVIPPNDNGFILMTIGNPFMLVNEKTMEIDPGRATAPLITNGRTMVPIRAIVEAMNGTAGWDEGERRVTLDCGGHTVFMWLNKVDIVTDGKQGEMDIAPFVSNDRTLLPVRFAAESTGCEIAWIPTGQKIVIVYKLTN